MELEIKDPETNILYTLLLNEDDYVRAKQDVYFATSLLSNAIKEQNGKMECEEEYNIEANDEATTSTNDVSVDELNSVQKHHVWQYSETLALIKSMHVHMKDLNHPKKKKYVFEKCCNDLLSERYKVSATQCQIKWKSLIRSYQSTKDNKSKTGRGPSRFQFFEEMDVILGTKPSNQCDHSIKSSVEDKDQQLLKENDELNVDQAENCKIKVNYTVDAETTTPKSRKIFEEKKYIQEQKNKRHAERMEIERQKLENDKEKVALLKAYLEKNT